MALKALDPTTKVSTSSTTSVAGRSAYELVLAPKDTRALVGQVRLAVDSQTSMPLRVQVFGKNSGNGPAFSVGFSSVSFDVPSASAVHLQPAAGGEGHRGHPAGPPAPVQPVTRSAPATR